jgi:DNA-binding CsgD family transcriptional regulator
VLPLSSIIVGRKRERAQLRLLLDRIERGSGGAIVVTGEAGVGKSSLLHEMRDLAVSRDFDVRIAIGTPSASQFAYGILRRLVEDGGSLPETLDPILAAILGVTPPSAPPSVTSVGTALLMHMSSLGEQRPILLIVDDVHWADQSSAAALAFAARRLLADRVAIVFGYRSEPLHHVVDQSISRSLSIGSRFQRQTDGSERADHITSEPATSFEFHGVDTCPIGPMTTEESVELLVARGCTVAMAHSNVAIAGGVPLAIIELAEQLRTGDRDDASVGMHLPLFYTKHIERLPTRVRHTLATAAIEDDLRLILAVTSPSAIADLELAEELGIVRIVGEHVQFRHPLLRAAALDASHGSTRRLIHRTIARKLDPITDADRIAVHLSESAVGFDEDAAVALVGFAERARGRGANEEAMEALIRASQLTPDRELAAHRMLDAADAIYFGGDAERGIVIAEEVLIDASSTTVRTRAEIVIANASMWDRSPIETRNRFVRVAEDTHETDPHRSIWALISASSMFMAGDLPLGLEFARKAEAKATVCEDMIAALSARGMIGWNLFLMGEFKEANECHETVDPLVGMLIDQEVIEGVSFGQMYAMRLIMTERFDEADTLLRRLLPIAQRLGAHLSVSLLSMVLAALRWRQGRWDEAKAYAFQNLVADDLPTLSFGWGSAAAAQITAAQGDAEQTERIVAEVNVHPVASQAPLIRSWANAALGHLRLSQGREHEALALLRSVLDDTNAMSLHQPEFFLWQGDLLDTLVATAHFDEAREMVDDLERRNLEYNLSWVHGVVARTRGCLAVNADMFEPQFALALAQFESCPFPFEVARTRLCRAQKRKMNLGNGQHGEAPGEDAARAFQMFAGFGAREWEKRAEDCTAITKHVSSGSFFNALSEGELRVALAVCAGRSNQEVAQELFLSSRTVEYHLTSIYRKLGLKNRQGLVAAVRERTIA